METSALAGGLKVYSGVGITPGGASRTIAATDVLSDFERTFFDQSLQVKDNDSPGLFSNQGISAMNIQEMSYWSIELHHGMLK